MSNVLKINFGRRRNLTSLLGLSLDGSRLEGVVLRRSNGSLQLQQSFSALLSLDPLTAAPELVGREIRNHLDAAGVRERHCVFGVPLRWMLTAHTEIPKLPEADAASLLQIEAERGFPSDPATLRLGRSFCPLKDGRQFVTMAGISAAQLASLEQVLAAAKLKPVSFALRLSALQYPGDPKSNGVVALAIGETQVSLQISCGGGVAAIRTLEGTIENETGQRALHADFVARETRITLGQLPPELRESVKRIRVFGPRDLAQQLADEMELRFEPMGLTVDVVTAYAPDEFGAELPPNCPVSFAFSLAARALVGQPAVFEFLPPKPTALQLLAQKYASGKYRTAGSIAAAILLIVGGLFGWQQYQLTKLNSQWSRMSAEVRELEGVQKQIRQYSPWFDESFRSLNILKRVTEAFPETGIVTAKTIEIRDGATINCSGSAQNNAAVLATLAKLRGISDVNRVKLESLRGKTPTQFSFDFHYTGGGNEN